MPVEATSSGQSEIATSSTIEENRSVTLQRYLQEESTSRQRPSLRRGGSSTYTSRHRTIREVSGHEVHLEQLPVYQPQQPLPPAYSKHDPYPPAPSLCTNAPVLQPPTRPTRDEIMSHSYSFITLPPSPESPDTSYRPDFAIDLPVTTTPVPNPHFVPEGPVKSFLINTPYQGRYYLTDTDHQTAVAVAIAVYARYDFLSDRIWIAVQRIWTSDTEAELCHNLTWLSFDEFMRFKTEHEPGRQVFAPLVMFRWEGKLDEKLLVRYWDERNEQRARGFEGPDEVSGIMSDTAVATPPPSGTEDALAEERSGRKKQKRMSWMVVGLLVLTLILGGAYGVVKTM